jgi:ABC-type transporter Mla subunit MlaD
VWFINWMNRVLEILLAIKVALDNLNDKGDQIMATLDEVKAAMDTLAGDVATAIQEITDLLAQLAAAGGDQAKIDALANEIQSTITALEAALPPVTPPEPTP